jgi:hypothetical protein
MSRFSLGERALVTASLDTLSKGWHTMDIDCYDTYATGHDGSILHFDVVVAAGTLKGIVEHVAAQFAGGPSPEVEAELSCRVSTAQASVTAAHRIELKQRGFAIVEKTSRKKLAA